MEREEILDLKKIFSALKKRVWMIVAITLISTYVAAMLNYFVLPPVYEVSAELIINKTDNSVNGGSLTQQDIMANQLIIDTYNVVIKSPRVMNQVAEKVGMVDKEEDLIKEVTVEGVKNSQVISISVQDKNQAKAVLIANTIAEVFQGEIAKIMEVKNVKILTMAKEKPKAKPVKPKEILNTSITFTVSLLVSIGIAFILESLDRTIKNEEEAEGFVELPVLGNIQHISDEEIKQLELFHSARKMGMDVKENII